MFCKDKVVFVSTMDSDNYMKGIMRTAFISGTIPIPGIAQPMYLRDLACAIDARIMAQDMIIPPVFYAVKEANKEEDDVTICPKPNSTPLSFGDIASCHRIYCYGLAIMHPNIHSTKIQCIYVLDQVGMEEWCGDADIYLLEKLQHVFSADFKLSSNEVDSITILGYWKAESTK